MDRSVGRVFLRDGICGLFSFSNKPFAAAATFRINERIYRAKINRQIALKKPPKLMLERRLLPQTLTIKHTLTLKCFSN